MVRLFPVLLTTGALLGLIDLAYGQYYASKYDHIDVDTILNNRRMVNYYAACLLSRGPCPPEGLEFKRILPEALRTNCQRCTEKQKTITLRSIRRLKKEYPKIWAQLEEIWDPDRIYVPKFESTFGTKSSEAPIQVLNRFGDSDNDNGSINNVISQIFTTPLPVSTLNASTNRTTTTTTTTSRPTSTTTSRPTSTSAATTTSRTTTTTKTTTPSTVRTKIPVTKSTSRRTVIITTNKPIINTILASTKPTRRPRPSIGASIQATVSLGTNIVGDLVRGLGAISNRVVETGAEIAGVVLKNIARPL